jgi:hypothetical protein
MLQIYWLDWNVHFTIFFPYHSLTLSLRLQSGICIFAAQADSRFLASLGMTNLKETNFKDAWQRNRARCR